MPKAALSAEIRWPNEVRSDEVKTQNPRTKVILSADNLQENVSGKIRGALQKTQRTP